MGALYLFTVYAVITLSLFSTGMRQHRCMEGRDKGQEKRLEVELIHVAEDDSVGRLRRAYELLLRAASKSEDRQEGLEQPPSPTSTCSGSMEAEDIGNQ